MDAAVREHRVQALLDGVPVVMVQLGVVAAWVGLLTGQWELATALLVANAVSGFDWFGRVAGSVVTEAPGMRAWMKATSELAGGGDLMDLPPGVDLVGGTAPDAGGCPSATRCATLGVARVQRGPRRRHARGPGRRPRASVPASWCCCSARSARASPACSARSPGWSSSTGEVRWNGDPIHDPQAQLRPARVSHVAQVPRVLSGSFTGNVALDHDDRDVDPALATARLGRDVDEAGGADALVGHRGVRLSGGQVQRLALARALACGADLLLADDVSSALDAATEVELWASLRAGGATVVGATSKAAALAQADRVVVLVDGRVVDEGPWPELSSSWRHLAG